MNRRMAIHTIMACLTVLLSASGCKSEGSGGLLGFLGGGFGESGGRDSSSTSGIPDFGTSSVLTLASDSGSSLVGGSSSSGIESVATVHHPEPASMALFGGGMAGMAWWRRRSKRRHVRSS